MKNSLSAKRIIDSLIDHYGIEITNLTLLPLGADIDAFVYRADTSDQHSYFVKIKRKHDASNIPIMDLLQEAHMEQIISPTKTMDQQNILQQDGFMVTVYPFVDGQDGFSRPLNDAQRLILGKTLKQLHDIDVPPSLQNNIRRETYSPKWRQAVRSLIERGQVDREKDEHALKLWDFIQLNLNLIHRLVDRADQLAVILRKESPEFVLCHSDIHGGNILIDTENKIYIVDWDDPIMASKERDLMFIGAGIDNIWNSSHERDIFYEGYGKADINMTALNYYRHERIVEDIAVYSQEVLFTNTKSEDKLVMCGYFMRMFEPRGVVERAFETDDKYVHCMHEDFEPLPETSNRLDW